LSVVLRVDGWDDGGALGLLDGLGRTLHCGVGIAVKGARRRRPGSVGNSAPFPTWRWPVGRAGVAMTASHGTEAEVRRLFFAEHWKTRHIAAQLTCIPMWSPASSATPARAHTSVVPTTASSSRSRRGR
jgi:hypothetical protein